ncbi:hypothetical protein CXF85_13820 [Colwellia sp. 75C3]|uniref:hypothetical protein n=1 Tax=Colwellia sp. 75C3 TaxID=888425 RepID=UPI000C3283D3|nr:hypothetical protein [Colwellia sp. 75C3]PKG82555.1 hypothetical protein CXF85_13820 [Colwellia sp. 75C3]
MNKTTLAAVTFALLGTTIMPASAIEISPTAQKIIDTTIANECSSGGCDLTAAITAAITNNPALAESLVAAAIAAVGEDSEAAETIIATAIIALGADSPQIANILNIATEAGVNSDTVTSIAIASGVDATIASEATAAGSTPANSSPISSTPTNKTPTYTSPGNSGGGGGGGGISKNQ